MSRTYAHIPYRVVQSRKNLPYKMVWGNEYYSFPWWSGELVITNYPRHPAVKAVARHEHHAARRTTKDTLRKVVKGEIDPDAIVLPEQKVLATAMWWD